MPFDWREYLEVARFLRGQGGSNFSEEAALRTLISRAYYAAYGHALRYSRDHLGFVAGRRLEDRTQDHGRLRGHLRQRRRALVASKLEIELDIQGIPFRREVILDLAYKGRALKQQYKSDFILFDKIMLEIKSCLRTGERSPRPGAQLPESHRLQTRSARKFRPLSATGI
jgi:PD-(D/E)XK nuclease superfamily